MIKQVTYTSEIQWRECSNFHQFSTAPTPVISLLYLRTCRQTQDESSWGFACQQDDFRTFKMIILSLENYRMMTPSIEMPAAPKPFCFPGGCLDPRALIASVCGPYSIVNVSFPDSENWEPKPILEAGNPGRGYYCWNWTPWKCILSSELKTLEVCAMFGAENHGSIQISLELKTQGPEVYTIFRIENSKIIVDACAMILVHACTMTIVYAWLWSMITVCACFLFCSDFTKKPTQPMAPSELAEKLQSNSKSTRFKKQENGSAAEEAF